ncbi:Beta-catenin-like protein 1 homolog [Sparassis crispa]|uniref:Beta-catenin-like protein 1 homolog n=1 Tax=Sparassis crispa TaxID=139825 RepID=A0A401GBC8_9APHY|nr:Beta-catenin-like protein 1 homolog [Sparassis crispa]GBE79478.1 Beta-catenin-like protein 1 homolog [Sparassis crispa]
MDIDKIFKVPKLPAGSNKRRMPDNPTPEMLKRMRMDTDSSSAATSTTPHDTSRGKDGSRAASVRDEEDEEDKLGGEFAPGGDADYFAEEDEEGRFYGGGLTKEQKDILNIFDKAGGEDVRQDLDEMTVPGVRRLLLRFERAVSKNQDQRSKYPDDPTKFIDSEADLDAAIKALLPLAQNPIISYSELVKTGSLALLIGLLSHENADIVIDVVEVIHELTDEDVGNEAEEDEESEGSRDEALKVLVESLLENSIFELLADNLRRLNEDEESDRQGVFHVLGIFENILGYNAELSSRLVSKTTILQWLLNRIEFKTYDENRGYAAELLSILLQNRRSNRLDLGSQNGVEIILKVLSQYRRKNPADAEETEFMENVFDSLCSALGEPEIKKQFLDCEGVDLMVLMMKDKMQSRSRSIKVLDYAMSGPSGTASCETFVEALGLKTLFSTFMGKPPKKHKGHAVAPASEDTSHSLGIISSLFTNLPSDSPVRIRLLAKFVENGYEKVEKLLEVRDAAQTRLKTVEKQIENERKGMVAEGEEVGTDEEDMWYLQRLNGGLFTMQTTDYILAWIAMEDDGIRAHIQQMLSRRDKSLKDIVKTLHIYHDNVNEDEMQDDGMSRREILRNLIAFLDAC